MKKLIIISLLLMSLVMVGCSDLPDKCNEGKKYSEKIICGVRDET